MLYHGCHWLSLFVNISRGCGDIFCDPCSSFYFLHHRMCQPCQERLSTSYRQRSFDKHSAARVERQLEKEEAIVNEEVR